MVKKERYARELKELAATLGQTETRNDSSQTDVNREESEQMIDFPSRLFADGNSQTIDDDY